MSAPSVSVRLPQPLRERVAARARLERRSFSNALRVLVETALDARRRAQMEAERAFVDEPVFEPCGEPALRLLGLACARSERVAVALSGGDRWA